MMKVEFNGKSFEISQLRAKHLRRISAILEERAKTPPKGLFSEMEQFFPFIAESIQVHNPDFKVEELDEMTLGEFNDIWTKIIQFSGVQLVGKGEQTPTSERLNGPESTQGSPAPSAGITVT